MNGHTAGFADGLVVESCLSHFEDVPFVSFQRLVDVNDVEILVLYGMSQPVSGRCEVVVPERCVARRSYHPQLMYIVAHNDCPVLCRIGVVANLLGDLFPDDRLLGEPLSRGACYGVLQDHIAIISQELVV